MAQGDWVAVTVVCALAAGGLTAAATRRHSMRARAVFTVLAALLVAGVMRDLGNVSKVMRFAANDDLAWSQIRQSYVDRVPAFADMIKLNPAIENALKAALLPVFRDRDKGSDARDAAAAAIFNDVLDKYIMPSAAHGSTEAVNAWGGITAPMLQRLAAISIEACAEYAMTRVARHADDQRIAALGETGYRAILDAYRTSDSSKYPLPERGAFIDQYVKALRSAQPSFSDEEFQALEDLDKQPPQRQCSLTLRLYEAIDKLDPSSKAIIFRYLMKKAD